MEIKDVKLINFSEESIKILTRLVQKRGKVLCASGNIEKEIKKYIIKPVI